MKEKPEEIQRLVDKWKHILEGPNTPLSACKCILIEPQEQWNQEFMSKIVNDNNQ